MPYYDPALFKENLKKTQFYFSVEQIRRNNEKRNKEKNNEINLSGYDKRDMNKMLDAARRQEAKQFGFDYEGEEGSNHNEPENKAPPEKKYFEGQGTSFGGSPSLGKGISVWYEGDTDSETIACVKMSLQDVIW